MASFSLITQGMTVGYNEDGFFVFGQTTNFKWADQGEYVHGESLPKFGGDLVEWRIDTNPKSVFEQYRSALDPEQVTKREALLKDHWDRFGQPFVMMERGRFTDQGGSAVVIYMSFPRDAALTAFIMPLALADKELTIQSGGWSFLSDDREAPAASRVGWDERFEPAFSGDLPILGFK